MGALVGQKTVTASFVYDAAGDRVRMTVTQVQRLGAVSVPLTTTLLDRYYLGGNYELDANDGTERLYLGGDAYSAPAVYVKEDNVWNIYYLCRDYLGSITHVVNANGSLTSEYSYSAWGSLRDPDDWTLCGDGSNDDGLVLGRGYTGHEYLPWFGLVNMNARLYDPSLGRFLSPDPYVQAPDFSQAFNRYSYALNNPLKYQDESGESITAIIIGALIGAYMGGLYANGSYNVLEWSFDSKTFKYMLFGGLTGAFVSGLGAAVTAATVSAEGSVGMASLFSTVYTSTVSSVFTGYYTEGQTDMTVNVGFGSWNLTRGSFDTFQFKNGFEFANFGYFLGMLGVMSDLTRGDNPGDINVETLRSSYLDPVGHTRLTEGSGDVERVLYDIGPEGGSHDAFFFRRSVNDYKRIMENDAKQLGKTIQTHSIAIKGVNSSRLHYLSDHFASKGFYNVFVRSCSSSAATALTLSGVPMLGVHPFLLEAQAFLWNNNVRSWNYSDYLTKF